MIRFSEHKRNIVHACMSSTKIRIAKATTKTERHGIHTDRNLTLELLEQTSEYLLVRRGGRVLVQGLALLVHDRDGLFNIRRESLESTCSPRSLRTTHVVSVREFTGAESSRKTTDSYRSARGHRPRSSRVHSGERTLPRGPAGSS